MDKDDNELPKTKQKYWTLLDKDGNKLTIFLFSEMSKIQSNGYRIVKFSHKEYWLNSEGRYVYEQSEVLNVSRIKPIVDDVSEEVVDDNDSGEVDDSDYDDEGFYDYDDLEDLDDDSEDASNQFIGFDLDPDDWDDLEDLDDDEDYP